MEEPFTMIPNRVIRELPANAIAVYCYIASFNPSFPGVRSIGKSLCMNKDTVTKYVKMLELLGLIERDMSNRRKTTYKIIKKKCPEIGDTTQSECPEIGDRVSGNRGHSVSGNRGPNKNKKKNNQKEERKTEKNPPLAVEGPVGFSGDVGAEFRDMLKVLD